LKFFSKDLVCVNASLSQFYGPLDNPTRFCAKIIRNLLGNIKHIDLTLGEQKRDFVYINDIVDAIILLATYFLEKTPGYYPYEIGTGVNTRLRDFVYLVKQIIGNTVTQLNFGALPYRDDEVFMYQLDLEPIFSLGWKPKLDLISGLTETIKQEIAYSSGV
jgi:CDP-paratose synthetase